MTRRSQTRDETPVPIEDARTGRHRPQDEAGFRFEDRRHSARAGEDAEAEQEAEEPARQPTLLDDYRHRAEEAEQKLLEYIEAFKRFKAEQEQVRGRLARDVDRKVELRFGDLVGELLEALDNLDLALEHVREVPEAEPLARGVELARKRFLDALESQGVEKLHPDGDEFDPHRSEAVRVDPVDSPDRDGRVTEVLRPGYCLGDRVLRAARVAVGRFAS